MKAKIKGVFIRLIGLIFTIVVSFFGFIPFVVTHILFGIDRANLFASIIMRYPFNWLFGDNLGDALYEKYKIIKVANKIITEMQSAGLTPDQMLKVIAMAREKFNNVPQGTSLR